MQERRRHRVVGAVSAVFLIVLTTVGVVALRGGIVEHANASALNDPDSNFVGVVGTVTTPPARAKASGNEWTQMSVKYTTADDRLVQTMVWTRRDNKDFDRGQRIGLEYVAQRPRAAQLPGNQGGEPEPWRTLIAGVGILAVVVVLICAWLYDAVIGRRRRRLQA